MPSRAYRSPATPPRADDALSWRAAPDDQIMPRGGRKRSGAALTFAITALVTIASGMALLDDRVRALWQPAAPPAVPAAPRAAGTESELQAKPAPEAADPASPRLATAEAVPTSAEPAEADVSATTAPAVTPERLPPPVIDPADPLQVKALAAGLHPDLSRTLLAKLTEADFRNAALAIRTALAETPDNENYTHPRKAEAGAAVFNIRFALGAPAECRRYVVTVIKDRWSHTALPMEKCGEAMRTAPRR